MHSQVLFEVTASHQLSEASRDRARVTGKRNVWSAALPQAKCESVTGWSAQMYTAFVGVNHSWPGWNALRSFPHKLFSLERLLPVTGLESAGFDRCAISSFASRPGKKP